MRLAFLGTPDFAVPTLEALVAAGHEIARVYTRPPRPAGRGRRLRPSPVHLAAEVHGLPVETPAGFRDPGVIEGFRTLGLDAAVVVAYGHILPPEVLSAPRLGCLNLHASLLPRWRGAAPIERAIMAGDTETGVCVMLMDEGLDTGPVLACERTPIGPGETAGSLRARLAPLGAALMVRTLAAWAAGEIEPRPQPAEGATYAPKIEKAEARIDWTRPAVELDRLIRALNPRPGAWCEMRGERVKVLLARPEEGAGAPGEVLDGRLLVACGEGALRLLELQRAGRAPVGAADFLRGFPVTPGERLS